MEVLIREDVEEGIFTGNNLVFCSTIFWNQVIICHTHSSIISVQ